MGQFAAMEEPCQVNENKGNRAENAEQFDRRGEEGVAVGQRWIDRACARPKAAAEPTAFDDAFLQFVIMEGVFDVWMKEQGVFVRCKTTQGVRKSVDDRHAAAKKSDHDACHWIRQADTAEENNEQCDGENTCCAKIRLHDDRQDEYATEQKNGVGADSLHEFAWRKLFRKSVA